MPSNAHRLPSTFQRYLRMASRGLLAHEFLLLVRADCRGPSGRMSPELLARSFRFVSALHLHAVGPGSRRSPCRRSWPKMSGLHGWDRTRPFTLDDHVADVGLHLALQRLDDDTEVRVTAVTELVDVAHGVQHLLRRASHKVADAVEVVSFHLELRRLRRLSYVLHNF